MKTAHGMLRQVAKLAMLLMLGASMSACAGLFGSSMKWKEEVLLHDGSKAIVTRTVERGGRHEIGQRPPIKDQSVSFTLPGANKSVTWEDKFTEDVGGANFLPMLLNVFKGQAYLVVYPMGCLSYNKWGRPNPPYVIFRYQSTEWRRIALQELPAEINTPNLIFSDPDGQVEKIGESFIAADTIQRIIGGYKQPEYKTILREPVKGVWSGCPDMVSDGNGGWIGRDWFTDQPSLEACLKYCEHRKIGAQYCLCNSIFKGK